MSKAIIIYYICFLIIATVLIYTYVDLFYNTISCTIDMPNNLREIYKETIMVIGYLIVLFLIYAVIISFLFVK